MRLAELATLDAAAHPPVLAIPVGSCEQHGPHLPLGTDTIIAEALAERLAARVPGVVVGPSIMVTASGEHAGFAGTLSIGTDATALVLVELARSADWAAGLVLVNGHGGNGDAVARAVATIHAEGRRVVSWWPHLDSAGSMAVRGPSSTRLRRGRSALRLRRSRGLRGRGTQQHVADAHAGYVETSLVLAIRPDLVAADRLEPGNTAPISELAPLLRAGGVAAVSPNGVLGDPRGATLSAGISLLDTITVDLVATVERAIRVDWARPPR